MADYFNVIEIARRLCEPSCLLGNYAFIDSQNVNLVIRDIGWKLDWSKFRIYISLLKKAAANEYLDFMNNLKEKLIYKN